MECTFDFIRIDSSGPGADQDSSVNEERIDNLGSGFLFMVDLTKGCPACGSQKLTEHLSGIKQEVHYVDGYLVKEVTIYPTNRTHDYVSCDNPKCGKEWHESYEI